MEDETEHLPVNTYDLIDQLDRNYPAQCIRQNETPEAAHRRAGWRDLIDALVSLKREEIEALG